MSKQISAGIIIKCPSGILMCHPSERPFREGHYDIPKGHVEEGEDFLESCARELKEETGLKITDISTIQDLGRFKYIPNKKDLYLFKLDLDHDINVAKLKCTSMFTSKISGRELPEMDGYVLSDDVNMLFPRLANVIKDLI